MTYNFRSRKRLRCSTPGSDMSQQRQAANAARTSLPSLPVELLLEIFSYWPSIPISWPDSPPLFPNIYLERSYTIRSLTQTCTSLRARLLPLAWQNLEACASRNLQKESRSRRGQYLYLTERYGREVATELVRQAEIVTIRNPSLVTYVQTVSVTLTKVHAAQVFEEFARCLALLPNVKTLQIFGLDFKVAETRLSRAFASVILPSVRRLAVPHEGVVLFPSVPNVRDITFFAHSSTYHTEYCALSVAKHFPHIERLQFRGSLVATKLNRITHQLLELRELGPIGLDHYVPMSRQREIVPSVRPLIISSKLLKRISLCSQTSLECLSRLGRIRVLHLKIDGPFIHGGTQSLSMYSGHIKLAKEILHRAPAQGQELKKLIVRGPASTRVYIGKGMEDLEEVVDSNSNK
ncbi:uncharacterized protein EV420DRAFT_388953 [Desarmillaria tabescens]|uniref:F-box domain-containing protein n=1 Tax=Armillaria tabescens TaxID=1929756 RepID=A0AA39KBT8_ARMTA|nr:uncharacterized protein EV420DRAFT_388953 [Desarmillaria tabescens]KAK0458272.1 hypothetical protein EV420DRAFT_388953 [Desarmillaria tabescens]